MFYREYSPAVNFFVGQHLLSYSVAVGAENVREEVCFLESANALKNFDLAFGVKTGLNEHFDECPVPFSASLRVLREVHDDGALVPVAQLPKILEPSMFSKISERVEVAGEDVAIDTHVH